MLNTATLPDSDIISHSPNAETIEHQCIANAINERGYLQITVEEVADLCSIYQRQIGMVIPAQLDAQVDALIAIRTM